MKLNLIFSVTKDNVIGVDNNLCISSSDDLKYFKSITTDNYNNHNNVVIMGYNTWLSLKKPLVNRYNVVITHNNYDKMQDESNNCNVFRTFEDSLEYLNTIQYGKIFVIGGAKMYEYVINQYSNHIENIYVTLYNYLMDDTYNDKLTYFTMDIKLDNFVQIRNTYHTGECKVYNRIEKLYTNKTLDYNNIIYTTKNSVNNYEMQYLNLLNTIRKNDNLSNGRNGQVYSTFGEKLVFNLENGFPILTTKKMPWKTILRELLWFISGDTNNNNLNKQKVHIWDQNASLEYMESRGLNYKEGDLGPIYGFQWRYFGAKYIDCDTNYKGKGFDQLSYVINEIKNNPSSRRIILNSWNASDIDQMSLPPCHLMVQFNIDGEYIDAQLYQRSGDMFLGVPFNITSYAFLLSIIGHITGYKPRKLIHILGNSHIYEEHLDSIMKQLNRVPYKFPTLKINNQLTDIDSIKEEYFEVCNYNSYGPIKAPMIT